MSANKKLMSFESLGWGFYYDVQGKYPLQKDEVLNLTPGEEFSLYYRCPPRQEEDGEFYGNTIIASKEFPFFFFGFYEKNDVYNNIFLFGTDDSVNDTLIGKVESFSMWERGLDDAEILNYSTNTPRMIGDDESYMYSSVDEAKEDGLFLHFDFDESNMVVNSFDDEVSSIKNRVLDIGSGKTENSTILDRLGDRILVSSTKFKSNFTLNFRYYIEEMKDFVLFSAEEIGGIRFDAANLSYEIELFPFIGNIERISIQATDTKIHHWYDFTFLYEDGVAKFYIDGILVETHYPNIDIGGVYRLQLNHDAFESIEVDTFYTFETYYAYHCNYCNAGTYPEYMMYDESLMDNFEIVLDHGSKNIVPMFIDKSKEHPAIQLGVQTRFDGIDIVSDNDFMYGLKYSQGVTGSILNLNTNNVNSVSIDYEVGSYNNYAYSKGNALWTQALVPSGMVRIDIKISDSISSGISVFPMIFTLPSVKISVEKTRMDNEAEYIAEDNRMQYIKSYVPYYDDMHYTKCTDGGYIKSKVMYPYYGYVSMIFDENFNSVRLYRDYRGENTFTIYDNYCDNVSYQYYETEIFRVRR